MKPFVAALPLALFFPLVAAPLTEADRMALIDQLDSLRGEAGQQASKRLDGAAAAFAKAMLDEEAATALYVQCVEKVDFEERERKAADFRDWKRRNKDRLDDPQHALALRHQLRWTVLTMKAAVEPTEKHQLADEVLDALEAIYRTPYELRGQLGILGQSVSSTVFARAYGLTGYEIKDWPMSPLQNDRGNIRVERPFHELVFPALRAAGDADALRAAWKRRIRFEEIARGFWSGDSNEEGESLAREKFLAERHPELVWDMEEDLFKAGDEQRAALALLEHLQKNIGHSQARQWEARFRELVDPVKEETAVSGG